MTIYYQFSGPSNEEIGFDTNTLKYLQKDCSAVKNVLVIASDLHDYKTTDFYYAQNYPWFTYFIPEGFSMSLLDARVSKEQGKKLIEAADCIHLMGGYTEQQQALLRYFSITKDSFINTKVVFGTSAGAMALGPVLMGTHDPDLVMSGLSCSPYVIWPHFDKSMHKDIRQQLSKYPNMIALEDDSGIRIHQQSITFINDGFHQFK